MLLRAARLDAGRQQSDAAASCAARRGCFRGSNAGADIATLTGPTGRAFLGSGQRLATLPPSASPQDEYDMAYGYVLQRNTIHWPNSRFGTTSKISERTPGAGGDIGLGESLFQQQRYRDAAESFPRGVNQVRTFLRFLMPCCAFGRRFAAMNREGSSLRHFD